jgi:hypothetical protein
MIIGFGGIECESHTGNDGESMAIRTDFEGFWSVAAST